MELQQLKYFHVVAQSEHMTRSAQQLHIAQPALSQSIHRLENEADDVYFRSIGELFKNTEDPIKIIKFKEFYEILEAATDRCESVANIIESIVLKHN